MSQPRTIALDAMGGDHGPPVVVAGAAISLERYPLLSFLFFGDEVFTVLEEKLRAQFPRVKFVSWREFGSTHAVNEKELLASLPQRFKELGVDAAISSMAC